ncbi:RNA polymerase sigma factor [Pedobacter agri]|uniref:RNA polymerase sigma factor n=1 Tax=Pedobacter agri TaxID=454586 RepID=UPI00292DFC2C|nr:sigma-70 family RNA polymerase sigma factor [Pedobacter agri]
MNQLQFAQMINEHKTMLSTFALKFTKDSDDANDLIQETMIKAIRFSAGFKEGTNVKGWLYTIMRNTFINDYRKITKTQSVISQQEELTSVHLMHSATHNQVDGRFAMRDIKRAIGNLPETLSAPFVRYVEGYKYHEIAIELNLPIGTVKTHIHEARKRLKKQLQIYRSSQCN